jgi:hypothetical protein
VLFAEPQSGIFVAVRAWLDDRLLPRVTVPLITSLATTALLIWGAVRARRDGAHADASRAVFVFLAVLAANSILSFAYTKDEIMSVAGAFYAMAAFAVVRDLLGSLDLRPAAAPAVVLLLGLLVAGWSVRASGVHYVLRSQAIKHQADWADLPGRWRRQGDWPEDPAEERLILQLRGDAIALELPNTRLDDPEWAGRIWPE